jgi:hypothetical protein
MICGLARLALDAALNASTPRDACARILELMPAVVGDEQVTCSQTSHIKENLPSNWRSCGDRRWRGQGEKSVLSSLDKLYLIKNSAQLQRFLVKRLRFKAAPTY